MEFSKANKKTSQDEMKTSKEPIKHNIQQKD
jgi:hypothetical protein